MAKAVATNNVHRWVPIGPSVIQFSGAWKRATGRVRDLEVSKDGKRAYAATAKGGLWYSEDAGQSWSPVGGWTVRSPVRGGVTGAQACGCLTVEFGTTAADDFVMIGTGEPQVASLPNRPSPGGLGVLSAKGPVTFAGGPDPWEPEAGISVFEGLGIFKLTRDPRAVVGQNAGVAGKDRVLAGTSGGLFLGERQEADAGPHNGKFIWNPLPDPLEHPNGGLGPFMGLPAGSQPLVTDVLWLTRDVNPNGRIVVAVALGLRTPNGPAPTGSGVAYSDDLGASYHWVTSVDPTIHGAHPSIGRMSLANPPGSNRVYVLGEWHQPKPPTNIQSLWRVENMNAATPATDLVGRMPNIWQINQRDYDQAIAVEEVAPGPPPVDRVYLGGDVSGYGAASVWCFNVQTDALVGVRPTLVKVPGISRTGVPPDGDGAQETGLIGEGVHPDVHNIRFAGAVGSQRQVWIATDGGIYVSDRAGRVNTFESRASGLAAVEVQFHAPHGTSTHFGAIGTQDNGCQVRIGDVVWKDIWDGDGGGVAFHPIKSKILVYQANRDWYATNSGFEDPVEQGRRRSPDERERNESAYFSGAAAVKLPPATGRIAVGTNRVWLSDDVSTSKRNTWTVLPFSTVDAPAINPRPGGADAKPGTGVPGRPYGAVKNGRGPFGPVLTLKWAGERTLLVLFAKGVVRWKQNRHNSMWSAKVLVGPVAPPGVTGAPNPATNRLSDLAPIPDTDDFYLVTTGDPSNATAETCLHFHDGSSTFRETGLRTEQPPLNPAYAVVVDPGAATHVYVGTATGVWHGERLAGPPVDAGAPWRHKWNREGTPQNVVQDLSVWYNPAASRDPRLLRAAMQSRGVWETDLNAHDEKPRTYIRVHAADDRRLLPTPMANPSPEEPDGDYVAYASPDIVVRPRPSPDPAPAWAWKDDAVIDSNNWFDVKYELWTFQTAFRWIYPSVAADGQWSPDLGRLIELHRATERIGVVSPKIDKDLWEAVVGGTTVDANGRFTLSKSRSDGVPGHAVYRPPWQTPGNMTAVATEIDLIDRVLLPRSRASHEVLYRGPSTVDVLIHHRDTQPLAANDAFAILLWRSAATQAALETFDVGPTRAYAVSCAIRSAPGPPGAGWNQVLSGGSPLLRLPVPLDARMPRAVSVDVDFTCVATGQYILIMAFVGSSVDPCAAPVADNMPANPTTIADLTRYWPCAAGRIFEVV
jgi:hypothetical protein